MIGGILFFILGALCLIDGSYYLSEAKSAVHQILGWIALLTGSVLWVGAGTSWYLGSIRRALRPASAERPAAQPEPEAPKGDRKPYRGIQI